MTEPLGRFSATDAIGRGLVEAFETDRAVQPRAWWSVSRGVSS